VDRPATEPQLVADRHDEVLALALGSLSVTQRFENMVSRAATPGRRPLGIDDPLVLAALGLVSLGRSLGRWLEEAAEPERPRGAGASSAEAPPTPQNLLR
jgi:hypothetical protein